MPEVLGTGFRWAFDGEPGLLILPGSDGLVDPATIEGMPGFPSKASQFAGLRVLDPPARRSAGCGGNTGTGRRRCPRSRRAGWNGRLATSRRWPAIQPAGQSFASACARELLHEHLAMYQALISE